MSYYHDSQARIDEAEEALRAGDDARARALYREAAGLQRAFIDSVSPDRTRTRSIYGVSAATLFYRAGDLDDAEQLAHRLLAEPWVEARSAEELRHLLTVIWSHRRDRAAPPRRQLPLMTAGRRLKVSRGNAA